ncbi:MAG: fructose-6-phosphate aldolase, partial [Allosphingosinicella sp.]
MKFFVDTADTAEISDLAETGLLDGVTTNPSLLAKVGRPLEETIKEICSIVDGPISAECVSLEAPGLITEGRQLAKIHDNVVVKIPMGVEGMKAVKALTAEGIKTNVTLVFSPNQALLCAKAGATYVSPFVGRLDDISQDGMEMVGQIIEIYGNYGFKTQVLVASVRNP